VSTIECFCFFQVFTFCFGLNLSILSGHLGLETQLWRTICLGQEEPALSRVADPNFRTHFSDSFSSGILSTGKCFHSVQINQSGHNYFSNVIIVCTYLLIFIKRDSLNLFYCIIFMILNVCFQLQIMTFGGNFVLMIALIICVCVVGSEEHNIVSLIVVQVKQFLFTGFDKKVL
jgi:hypothetical protein